MKRLTIALGIGVAAIQSALPAIALAQHADHGQHGQPAQHEDHSGHTGHAPRQQQAVDPHAGHTMPGTPASDAPPAAPPPPEAFVGPEHAASTIFDPELFERKRQEALIAEHGGFRTWMISADQFEYRARDGRDSRAWDIEAWYGGDYRKWWLTSEGELDARGKLESAEVQALHSRALNAWYNVQAGVRHDFRPAPDRTHLVLGVSGLAPYWIEVDGSLFLSDEGDLTARVEAEYDLRITNQLILQPAIEIDFAARDIPELDIGAGLSSIEAGLRLRYEIAPEFAPYIGVEYERSNGRTADFARAAGEDVSGWSVVIGVRGWL